LNTLLLVGAVLGVAHGRGNPDPMVQGLVEIALPIYTALCLALAFLYGVAAAAWTGWSWWRVPPATLAGAALGWNLNALLVGAIAKTYAWPMAEKLPWKAPDSTDLVLTSIGCMIVLVALAATLWKRYMGGAAEASEQS
jgi:hypothetical protein